MNKKALDAGKRITKCEGSQNLITQIYIITKWSLSGGAQLHTERAGARESV